MGAQIVAITDYPTSPLTACAHHSLFVASGVRSTAWWSQAGAISLINWIITLAMHRDPKTVSRNLQAYDIQIKQLGHWRDGEDIDQKKINRYINAEHHQTKISKKRARSIHSSYN